MKKHKLLGILPPLLALLLGLILIIFLFPQEFWFKIIAILFLGIIICVIGYNLIQKNRLESLREQLMQVTLTLEEFDIDEPSAVKFKPSAYPVLNDLNANILELINRIRENYRAGKQFTQNASHELQTPLAVIKGQVELLIQSPNMGEKEMNYLVGILQNTNRLAKLNGALILLSKIDNRRFSDIEKINLRKTTEEIILNFKDLIKMKEIEIRWAEKSDWSLEMSEILSEILIGNLLQNAIRHNREENGFIEINCTAGLLSISNPGKPSNVPGEAYFKRFERNSDIEESLGLGLSIVRRICNQFDLIAIYDIKEELHTLSISKKV